MNLLNKHLYLNYLNLLLVIFFSTFNFTFSQAQKQDKSVRASMVYGYITGIESTLESVLEYNPSLNSRVNNLYLILNTNFGESKVNAMNYMSSIGNWESKLKHEIDSLKQVVNNNIRSSSSEQIESYLKVIEYNLKGNIPSPLMEYVLSFQYENKPAKEFSNGYTYTFNTKGHKKSKNAELILTIPKSWSSQEGKQPNIIQLFTSDCGSGTNTISVLTEELPFSSEELGKLSFEEIDEIYKEDIFTLEYAKNLSKGKFISYKPMKIAGRSGFLVEYEIVVEKMGNQIKMRNKQFVFHNITHLHFINCGIGTDNINENLEDKLLSLNSLFFMIVNSVVVTEEKSDIIHLKGTSYQKIIDVKIDDKNYSFILDTGATNSLISKKIINSLLKNGIITNRNFIKKGYTQTADGRQHLVEFWNVPSVIVGGKRINDINFVVIEGNIEPLLGMDILIKLDIWKIDLENNKIHLKGN